MRDWKKEITRFIGKCQRARTRHNKVCKVDRIMKFEVNMIRHNEAKPIHYFQPSNLAPNNLMYQSKIIFPQSQNSYVGYKSDLPFYLQIKMTLIPVGVRFSSLNETGVKILSGTQQLSNKHLEQCIDAQMDKATAPFSMVRHFNTFITF